MTITMDGKYAYASDPTKEVEVFFGKLNLATYSGAGWIFHNLKGIAAGSPDYNLVPLEEETFKRGDPVIVSYLNMPPEYRYYSHEENGAHLCFDAGKTAWTSKGKTSPWTSCRHPTPEELKEST